MADIKITIPTDKISLVVDAVNFHVGLETTLTTTQAKAWLKDRMMSEVKALVRKHQEYLHNLNLVIPEIE